MPARIIIQFRAVMLPPVTIPKITLMKRMNRRQKSLLLVIAILAVSVAGLKAQTVQYADTATMLNNYLRKSDTSNMLDVLLRKTDTAGMLTGYERKGHVLRLNDTAAMLSGLQRSGDPVTVAVQPFITSIGTLGALTVSGTASMYSLSATSISSATGITATYASIPKLAGSLNISNTLTVGRTTGHTIIASGATLTQNRIGYGSSNQTVLSTNNQSKWRYGMVSANKNTWGLNWYPNDYDLIIADSTGNVAFPITVSVGAGALPGEIITTGKIHTQGNLIVESGMKLFGSQSGKTPYAFYWDDATGDVLVGDAPVSGITAADTAAMLNGYQRKGQGGSPGNFLPLAGGTLTGNLSGAGATFSNDLLIQNMTVGTRNSYTSTILGQGAGEALPPHGTSGGNWPDNTFVGFQSGYSTTSGQRNSYFGSGAGAINTTGAYNVAVGYGAGYFNTTGSLNTSLGYAAGYNSTGGYNTVIGGNAAFPSNTQSSSVLITDGNGSHRFYSPASGNILFGSTTDNGNKLQVTGNATISGNVTGTSIIKSGGTSSQFLKADGSVDSNTYLTVSSLPGGSGYLPLAGGTLTGPITANLGDNSTILNNISATTGYIKVADVANGAGQIRLGVESATAGTTFSGSLGNATFLGTNTANALQLYTGDIARMTFAGSTNSNYTVAGIGTIGTPQILGTNFSTLNIEGTGGGGFWFGKRGNRNAFLYADESSMVLNGNGAGGIRMDVTGGNWAFQASSSRAVSVYSTFGVGSALTVGTSATVGSTLGVTGLTTSAGFKTPSGTSSQFLKADGTVDNSVYLTASSLPANPEVFTQTGNLITPVAEGANISTTGTVAAAGLNIAGTVPVINVYRYNGTIDNKMPVTKNTGIGSIRFNGEFSGSNSNYMIPTALVAVTATEDYTATARGTRMSFATTAIGSFTAVNRYAMDEFSFFPVVADNVYAIGKSSLRFSKGYFADTVFGSKFVQAGGTSSQFLKADGSVDENSYLTSTGAAAAYLPFAGGTLTGNITAPSFTKAGGTASQFLKADGTVDGNSYLTTTAATSAYLPFAGGTLTGNIIAPSFTKTGGTASQFLKADGSVDNNTYLTASSMPPLNYLPLAGGTITGPITANLGDNSTILNNISATTGYIKVADVANGAGQIRLGVESATAGTTFSGSLGNATFLGTNTANALQLYTGDIARMTFAGSTNSNYTVAGIGTIGTPQILGTNFSTLNIEGTGGGGFWFGKRGNRNAFLYADESSMVLNGNGAGGIRMDVSGGNWAFQASSSRAVSVYSTFGVGSALTVGTSATVGSTLGVTGLTTSAGFKTPSGTASQFLKADGSVDGTSYLTSAGAAATYLPVAGGTLTGNIVAPSFIKAGGTASQFLKADGSVDGSAYLTTAAATSAYLPFAGGTLTGNIIAPSFTKAGGTASQFLKADGSVDNNSYLTTGSATANFLPLAGGTLTGTLDGLNANFNGTVRVKKITVTPAGWADYVFAHDYKLRTLDQVAAYIETNKHLPDMPSAKEVEEKGISLGDNQALLLRKIEELTLYVIDLKKEINELKKDKKTKTGKGNNK
jgi:hypothetical protein